MADKIIINEEDVLDFYDQFGSKNFQLQQQTLGEFGNKKLDVYFKSLSMAPQITAAIGVIAGFGFTAYGYIESKILFFLGEAILVYGILNGLLWLQKAYKSEYDGLDQFMNKQQEYYDRRNAAFITVYEQLISPTHEINRADMDALTKIDKEALEIFKPIKQDPPKIYSRLVYDCLAIGTIILFASFVIKTIGQILLYIFFC